MKFQLLFGCEYRIAGNFGSINFRESQTRQEKKIRDS